MNRFIGVLQLAAAGMCLLAGAATVINLAYILPRPETISVVNTMIGHSVLIICSLAGFRILYRKGIARVRNAPEAAQHL